MPGRSLADRIEQQSAIEAFPARQAFVAQGRVRDQGDYACAAADRPAWWAEQARQRLDWHTPFSAVLDESNPPFHTAVIATSDELIGQAVVAYVTLGQGSAGGPALQAELRDHIAGRIGKLARPKQIIWTEGPGTREKGSTR